VADSSRNAFMTIVEVATRASDVMSHAEITSSKITSMYSDQQQAYVTATDKELQDLLDDMDGKKDTNDITKANTAYQVAATEQNSGMSFFSGITSRSSDDVGRDSDSQGSMFTVTEDMIKVVTGVTNLLAK